jgi:uncharacterized circularly permuted ATP-grasp superfamily protein
MSNQKTTIQKLIEWCKQNAFNIEDQSGVKYVVIDYEEMKLLFPELKENEREQIIDSHVECVKQGTERESETEFTEEDELIVRKDIENYYNQTYGGNK